MKKIIIALLSLCFAAHALAANHVINFNVENVTVNFAGKPRQAITVNGQIPAPTLHFKQGDHVTINVTNKLKEETAIHWHGIILPWQMDGVLGVSQHGIQPGKTFHYEFTLRQSGTYWYHAHAGLQEQQGLYGAFLIDPPAKPAYHYTKDYVVVLSDWSNTHPDQILANLKKEGDYYSPRFPLQPSLVKFIHDYRKASSNERKNLIDDYKMMQQMRMSIYDISDVAYDAFLLNGGTNAKPWTALVKVGDIVRLRFIGAGGSTVFHVKIPDAIMEMVHVEGNDIVPYTLNDFTIAPGETYDVLVRIKQNKPYIIYAESIDTVGAAYGTLVTSANQFVNYKNVSPFPEPLPVTRGMMSMMMGSMHTAKSQNDAVMSQHQSNQHSGHMKMATVSNHGEATSNSKPMKMNHDMQMSEDSDSSMEMKMPSGMKMNDEMPMQQSEQPKTETTPKITTSSSGMQSMQGMQMNPQPVASEKTMPMEDHSKMDKGTSEDHMSMESKSSKMTKMQHSKTTSHDMNMMMDMSSMPNSHAKMAMNMNGMDMKHGMNMSSGSMDMSMPTEPSIIGDGISAPTASYQTSIGTKYEKMKAAVKTNDPTKPVDGVINMELFGYMDRYIWFINGVPEYKAKPIILEPGKRYRFVFTNTSMMRHPMHIHGHWFILRKGNGAYDPLLHTIEVAPGATITADVDTDASGQWLFHCHLLYHMMTGMSRVFQYSTLIELTENKVKPQDIIEHTPYKNRPIVRVDEVRPIDKMLVEHPMAHTSGLWLATYLDVGVDPFINAQRVTYKGLYGSDYNKLELFTNDAEVSKGKVENADIDVFYWRLVSQFWALKGGVNYFYRPAASPYWQPGIGIEGLMPYFIDTDVRAYVYGGSAKLDIELSRDTQITNNFFIRVGTRGILASKTVTAAAIGGGLNQMRYIIRPYYRLTPGLNLAVEYERELTYGAFRAIQSNAGESTNERTLTFGLTLLF